MSSADKQTQSEKTASYSLPQRALAECLGTAMLLSAVIGSGMMAERLSGGNNGVALLANTLATVFALFVLIETLGPISGAHFNPLVSLIYLPKKPKAYTEYAQAATIYIAAQLVGAVLGAWLANAMFDLPVLQTSAKLRGGWNTAGQFMGWGQWLAEAVATAGLIFVIARAGVLGENGKKANTSAWVACYIGAAYWFAASTSFANPAAVLGRMLSDSFAGIAPVSALGFVAAQCVGAVLGWTAAKAFTTTAKPLA